MWPSNAVSGPKTGKFAAAWAKKRQFSALMAKFGLKITFPQQLAQFDPNPCHSTNVTSQCLYEPQNKRTGVKRGIYIIYKYHGGDFWPLLQLQAAMPVTEITPQQPSYFEPKSACTWHAVSIYPPQDQMKRIGEKNSISMT